MKGYEPDSKLNFGYEPDLKLNFG